MVEKVRTSTRLWSAEVALARAQGEVDATSPGTTPGVAALERKPRQDYTFSNGRTFEQKGYQ